VYDTPPKIGVVPCHTVNVAVEIEFGSIGVLKVAEITLTAATLADFAIPLFLEVADILLTVAAIADSLALLILLRASFVTPLAGDVRITVGAVAAGQTFTIPGPSSLQPTIKMTRSKAAANPAKSEKPKDTRISREKCVHRLKAVVGFVDEVFMTTSLKS
jgi:hypothetical protein